MTEIELMLILKYEIKVQRLHLVIKNYDKLYHFLYVSFFILEKSFSFLTVIKLILHMMSLKTA